MWPLGGSWASGWEPVIHLRSKCVRINHKLQTRQLITESGLISSLSQKQQTTNLHLLPSSSALRVTVTAQQHPKTAKLLYMNLSKLGLCKQRVSFQTSSTHFCILGIIKVLFSVIKKKKKTSQNESVNILRW